MTIAPNIIDPAEERVRLAGALAAAAADLQRLVERDKAAEARASDVEEAAAVVLAARDAHVAQLEKAIDEDPVGAVALVETLNKIDEDVAMAQREKGRASSELGTARAERAKAAAAVDDLRARLRKLVAG